MVGRTSQYISGCTVTSTIDYLAAVRNTITKRYPQHHTQDISLIIDRIQCDLVDLDLLHGGIIALTQLSVQIASKCVVEWIKNEVELSTKLEISDDQLVNHMLDNVPEAYMYLVDMMEKNNGIIGLSLGQCILVAVKSLLERTDEGYGVSIVESIRSRFSSHQLFPAYHYSHLYPIPGTKEAIVYMMDTLEHWTINIFGYNQFAEFIFDQLVIQHKRATMSNEKYSKQILFILSQAVHHCNRDLLQHIISCEGQFSIPDTQGLFLTSSMQNGILQYIPAIGRIFATKVSSVYNISFKSVELVKWLQTDQVESSLGFHDSFQISSQIDTDTLDYMLRNEVITKLPRSFFKSGLDLPSPVILSTIYETQPAQWNFFYNDFALGIIRGGSLDICKQLLEIDKSLLQLVQDNIQSLVRHIRPDVLMWLHDNNVDMQLDDIIKEFGDPSGVWTIISIGFKQRCNNKTLE
eukprot:gene20055-24051_t